MDDLPLRKVRLWLPSFPHTSIYWDIMGWAYARAFATSQIPTRAVCPGRALDVRAPEWAPYAKELFDGPGMDEHYVNVVVGYGAWSNLWTKEVLNVAITACEPRMPSEAEILDLRTFDAVFAITPRERDCLAQVGIQSDVMLPTPASVHGNMTKFWS